MESKMFDTYIACFEAERAEMSDDAWKEFYHETVMAGYQELCDLCHESFTDFILNTAMHNPTDTDAVLRAINPQPHMQPYVEFPNKTEQACKILSQSPDKELVKVSLSADVEFITETQFITFKGGAA